MFTSTSIRCLVGIALATATPLALASAAHGSPLTFPSVHVEGRILRPAYFQSDDAGALREKSGTGPHRYVPASGQKIRIIQPPFCRGLFDRGGTCATLYTDSEGQFSRDVSCGSALPCKLFVQVVGERTNQYQIAVANESKLTACVTSAALAPADLVGVVATAGGAAGCAAGVIAAAPPFLWDTDYEIVDSSSSTVDFGDFRLGIDGPYKKHGFRAAAVLEAVDFAYRQAAPTSAWSKWVVNNPLFGSPTTIESTVHMETKLTNEAAIGAVAHELGHVMYNKKHFTSMLGYWTEVLNYAFKHERCTTISSIFAHYEGFAHAFSDILWRDYALGAGSDAYGTPASMCKTKGFQFEGNVADVLTLMVHGENGYQRTSPAVGHYELATFGSDQVNLMPLEILYEVAAASNANTLPAVWANLLRTRCKDTINGQPMYCGTKRFMCRVKHGEREPNTPGEPYLGPLGNPQDLDPSLAGLDCTPATSAVATLTQQPSGSMTRVDVTFPRADNTNYYRIQVYRYDALGKKSLVSTYNNGTALQRSNIQLTPCKKYAISITTVNDWGTASGVSKDFWANHPICAPEPPTITGVSCKFNAAMVIASGGSTGSPTGMPLQQTGSASPESCTPGDPAKIEPLLCTVTFKLSPDTSEHEVVIYDGGDEKKSYGWYSASSLTTSDQVAVTAVKEYVCSSSGTVLAPAVSVAVRARIVVDDGTPWVSQSNKVLLSL